jgi:hypothetical protein
MFANPSQVVVTSEPYGQSHVPRLHVYHREFPEVCGDGESPKAAADWLIVRLSLTLDHAPSQWRQVGIRQAIEDVRAFAGRCLESRSLERSGVDRISMRR